jgi:hypothetical protein
VRGSGHNTWKRDEGANSSWRQQNNGNQIALRWHKSSYGGNGGGDCVEVARNLPGDVAVRDSKDPHGPVLTIESARWRDFIADVKAATD